MDLLGSFAVMLALVSFIALQIILDPDRRNW